MTGVYGPSCLGEKALVDIWRMIDRPKRGKLVMCVLGASLAGRDVVSDPRTDRSLGVRPDLPKLR